MEPEDENIDEINYNIDQQIKSRALYNKEGVLHVLNTQSYTQIMKQKEKFDDDLFPSNNSSIYNYMAKYSDIVKKKESEYGIKVQVLIIN